MTILNSITISRKEERSFDYASLRLEALETVQKLCGKVWTDYNAHDPGVTILEQIVFALTELGYKTGFDIKDYLSSSNGTIDYELQALYSASAVMESFPVTPTEYSQFFKNKIQGAQSVRFTVAENGQYHVEIYMNGTAKECPEKMVLERFWHLWKKWRCMGDRVSNASVKWTDASLKNLKEESEKREILPEGEYHHWTDFFPIIELFPTIYREGESAEPLKKFLAPIEYIFKRFLDLLENFSKIFAADENSLSADKALNQMLAMYGVRFPELSFLDSARILRCKIQFLKDLPSLLQHRTGRFWRKRVELMLGILHNEKDLLRLFVFDSLDEKEAGKVQLVFFENLRDDAHTRREVEFFICQEIPAHLLPEIYWTSMRELQSFENIYKDERKVQDWLATHQNCLSNRVWL